MKQSMQELWNLRMKEIREGKQGNRSADRLGFYLREHVQGHRWTSN